MFSYRIRSVVTGDTGRRVYVFLAVSLAGFVLAIAAICVTGGLARPAKQLAAASQNAESRQAILSANQQYAEARGATRTALAKLEAADAQFLAFLDTHFAELIDPQAEIDPVPNSTVPAQESSSAEERKSTAAQNSAATPDDEPTISTESERATSQPPDKPPWGSLSEQLAKLQEYRKRLLETLQPSHPSVGAVDLAISDVTSQLRKNPEPSNAAGEAAPKDGLPQDSAAQPPRVKPLKTDSPAPIVAETPAASDAHADRAARLERWRQADVRFRELADEVNDARQVYHEALAREQAAWQHQEQTLAENPVALTLGTAAPSPANTRRILEVCGWLAVGLGLSVSIWARRSERVFRSAAEVRQALDLAVLGEVPRPADAAPRERPQGEPHWVGTAVHSSEIWLAGVVVMLAVIALADHEFLARLIADPLAACSGKFW